MSTAVLPQIQGYVMNPKPALRSDLAEVVKDILVLRAFTRQEGGMFKTHKSQRMLLQRLNPQDLAMVLRALDEAERSAVQQ